MTYISFKYTQHILLLSVLSLIIFSMPTMAIPISSSGANTVLRCVSDMYQNEIQCTWDYYPFFPWIDWEYPSTSMDEASSGGATCVAIGRYAVHVFNDSKPGYACAVQPARYTCYDYFGSNVSARTGATIYSEYHDNVIMGSPYYVSGVYSSGKYRWNISGLLVIGDYIIQCKALGERFVNQVDINLARQYQTAYYVQNITMYSNGTNLYMHSPSAQGTMYLQVAYSENGSTVTYKTPGPSAVGLSSYGASGAGTQYLDNGFVFGLNTHQYSVNTSIPATPGVYYTYTTTDSTAGSTTERISIMSYVLAGSGPTCLYSRTPNQFCNTDCDCSNNYLGYALTCDIGLCKVQVGASCATSSECMTDYSCTGGFCVFSGTTYTTTYTYTISPSQPTGGYFANTSFLMKMNYKILATGLPVPETTHCYLYLDDSLSATGSCASTFNISIGNSSGRHSAFIVGVKGGGYISQYGAYYYYDIQSTTNNLPLGSLCSYSSQCNSSRCTAVRGDPVYSNGNLISCYFDSECGDTLSYYCDAVQQEQCTTDAQCRVNQKCNTALGWCVRVGYCKTYPYLICAANNWDIACNYNTVGSDTGFIQCSQYLGKQCNPSTFTCSLNPRQGYGTICSSNNTCLSGKCGDTYGTSPLVSVCCDPFSDWCCNNEFGCPGGYYCDLNSSFRCIPYGAGQVEQTCEVDSNCSTINGYYCEQSTKRCVQKPVSGCSYPYCSVCSDHISDPMNCTSPYSTSLLCMSPAQCAAWSGLQASSLGGAAGAVDLDTIFSQLLNLIYYVIVTVIIFFVIAVFISGLHLAYGLVKG